MKAFYTDNKTFLIKAYDQAEDWQIKSFDINGEPLKHAENWRTKSIGQEKESLIYGFEAACKWNGIEFNPENVVFA